MPCTSTRRVRPFPDRCRGPAVAGLSNPGAPVAIFTGDLIMNNQDAPNSDCFMLVSLLYHHSLARPGDLFQHRTAIDGQDMPYRTHTSAGRWSAAAGSHIRNHVRPGVYDRRQAIFSTETERGTRRATERHSRIRRSDKPERLYYDMDGQCQPTQCQPTQCQPTAPRASCYSFLLDGSTGDPARDV